MDFNWFDCTSKIYSYKLIDQFIVDTFGWLCWVWITVNGLFYAAEISKEFSEIAFWTAGKHNVQCSARDSMNMIRLENFTLWSEPKIEILYLQLRKLTVKHSKVLALSLLPFAATINFKYWTNHFKQESKLCWINSPHRMQLDGKTIKLKSLGFFVHACEQNLLSLLFEHCLSIVYPTFSPFYGKL